jgi:hypothetical protein
MEEYGKKVKGAQGTDGSSRTTVWVAAITGATTVLAAAVPILLSRGSTIDRLDKELTNVKKASESQAQELTQMEGARRHFGGVQGLHGRWRISGMLAQSPFDKGVAGAKGLTVYAVPGNQLTATTGDDGRFILDVPAGLYQVLLRDESSTVVSVLLDPNPQERKVKIGSRTLDLDFAPTDSPAAGAGEPQTGDARFGSATRVAGAMRPETGGRP